MSTETPYIPDHRLRVAYEEARELDDRGIEALCPSYLEVAGSGPRYEHEVLLGRGSTKEVFRAWDSRMKRWIALARLRPDCGPETYDAFIHEAWLTSSLSHPNIIGIHDLGVDEKGRPFFTMTLKGGRTLAEVLSAECRPPLTELLGIIAKVGDAVASAHSCRTLHLDLKPENIQVDAFGEVLVCDWGLGLILPDTEENSVRPAGPPALAELHDSHSLTGEIRGTPGYMAPEQATADAPIDERTDVFALGCLLHAVLTGEAPITGGDREEQLQRTREAGFVSPRVAYPHRVIPPSLEAVFHKASAHQPAERYPAATTFRDEIARYLAGYATAAERAGFFREAGLLLRRNRVSSAAILLGLVGLTVLSVLFVQKLDRQRALTAVEHAKSTALAGDVTRLEDLYATQSDEFRESARELAGSFANSADTLKNLGIFNEPLKSIDEAAKLAGMALTLDPACEAARLQQFDLFCHTLDFKSALAAPRMAANNPFADYLEIAAVAPDFDFNARRRPTVGQLAGFLRAVAARNPNRAPLMERIVCYDIAARRELTAPTADAHYEAVVSALVAYANPDWNEAGFRYDTGRRALTVEADRPIRLTARPGGGSGRCLLRFIPFRDLKLAIAGPLRLSDLERSPCEELDLRGCPSVVLDKVTSLPLLRTVHVRKGQFSPGQLVRALTSAVPYVIDEAP